MFSSCLLCPSLGDCFNQMYMDIGSAEGSTNHKISLTLFDFFFLMFSALSFYTKSLPSTIPSLLYFLTFLLTDIFVDVTTTTPSSVCSLVCNPSLSTTIEKLGGAAKLPNVYNNKKYQQKVDRNRMCLLTFHFFFYITMWSLRGCMHK